MSNKRVGGIPYLRTTFKFDFNSMENMDEDAKSAFVEELKIRLLPCVELFDIDIPGPSSGHELKVFSSFFLFNIFRFWFTSKIAF